MRILAMETSAKAASAAISENGTILCADYQDTGLTHSRTLMPMVEHLLSTAGFRPGDMDAFAVSVGPGSFTGIRIGVAAAKGLAFGADRPAIGVSTLAALARNVSFAGGLIVCAMDARRAQIYNALFAGRGEHPVRLTEDRAISLEDLAAELAGGKPAERLAELAEEKQAELLAELIAEDRAELLADFFEEDQAEPYQRVIVAGDGMRLCTAFLMEHGIPCEPAPPHLACQNAMGVAMEAETLYAAGKLVTAQELRPFYLRPPSALPLRERRRKGP